MKIDAIVSMINEQINQLISEQPDLGALSVNAPGRMGMKPSPPPTDDTLAAGVGNLEAQVPDLQGQLQQMGATLEQIGAIVSQDPENPLSAQVQELLAGGLSESLKEEQLPDAITSVPQQGVERHYETTSVVDPGDGEEAKTHLSQTLQDVEWLAMHIGDLEDLEAWVQAKIMKASEYLNSARNYLEYEKVGKY